MDTLKLAFEALPTAASSPYAFVAYLFLLVCIVIISWKTSRNKNLLKRLEKLPAKDRLSALKSEMGSVDLKGGLSAEQWLRHKRNVYLMYGFIAVLMTALIVIVITLSQASDIKDSRDELVEVLNQREATFLAQINELISGSGVESEAWIAADKKEEYETEQRTLVTFREKVIEINKRRVNALEKGRLVLAHELGNELEKLGNELQPLIMASTERREAYAHMFDVFSTMNPHQMSANGEMVVFEEKRMSTLNALIRSLDELLYVVEE